MGLPLLNTYQWSFQTRPNLPPPPPPGTPHVATSDPQPYAMNLPVAVFFTFTFSEAMDATTLTDQTILLRALGSPDDVPVQIDYPATGVLTVTPTVALSPGTRYVLAMDENVIQSAATPPQQLGGLTQFPLVPKLHFGTRLSAKLRFTGGRHGAGAARRERDRLCAPCGFHPTCLSLSRIGGHGWERGAETRGKIRSSSAP